MRAVLVIMVAIAAIPGVAGAASVGIGSVVEIQDDTPVDASAFLWTFR